MADGAATGGQQQVQGFTSTAANAPRCPLFSSSPGHKCTSADKERAALVAQIETLTSEKQQSQLAFDTYRERAKASLVKSATDQKASETKLTQALADAAAEKNARVKAEAAAADKAAVDAALGAAKQELAQAQAQRAKLDAALAKAQTEKGDLETAVSELEAALASERSALELVKVGPLCHPVSLTSCPLPQHSF